jgi:hypothetical protein
VRRLFFVPVLAFAIVGALALPAGAKGPAESASAQVVITGPGVPGGSMKLQGTVEGFQEPGAGFIPTDSGSDREFTAFLVGSGLLSNFRGDQGGWFVLSPKNLRSLGPAYEVRLNMSGEAWSESATRQLYPFAPERPLVFIQAASVTIPPRVRMQHSRGLWWSASPALLPILQAHGLPRSAPPLAEPPPPAAPTTPQHPQGWVLLGTALALLGLLIAGVMAGRRRMGVI